VGGTLVAPILAPPHDAAAYPADKESSMKRCGLILATLLSLLLTGFTTTRVGWLGSRPGRPSAPRHASTTQPKDDEPLSGEAALRYRQCQPTHWRACLIQP
jgi:hypothetical protein